MSSHRILRSAAWVVLAAFTSLTMQPLTAAIQQSNARAKAAGAPAAADERYDKVLRELQRQADRGRANKRALKPYQDEVRAIRALKRELEALEPDVEAGFTATEAHLRAAGFADTMLPRHAAAVAAYRAAATEFHRLARDLEAGDDQGSTPMREAALEALGAFFEKHSQQRRRAPLDPNKLPWRTPKAEVRAPFEDEAGFRAAFGEKSTKLAGAMPAGLALPMALAATPGAEDLAETEDVQLTPLVRDKAAELGRDPLAIYNWVRNNVQFVPSYGSIQGSDMTLRAKRGNSFDIASLLIALYRAAGIPARYAHGTIEVAAARAMNWVGGVSRPQAAQQLLGQGGVPNVALVSGGEVRAIRLEHVWVEAYLDFVPSRGAKPRAADSWVPMDASYKQHTFTAGMDLPANVPLDPFAVRDAALVGATVNTADGWVQNLNTANVQSAVAAYQGRIRGYVDARNPDATIGDVMGAQAIVPRHETSFPGALPYRMVVKGATYATLPDRLRHQFTYVLYASDMDRMFDSPIFTFTRSLPRLAGKPMTLTYRPATQADQDLIASYLPKPHADGSPVQPSELPAQIPAYARVVPELKVDGVVAASGGSFSLGTELAARGGFTELDFSGWDLTNDDSLIAGQPSAIGISLMGISGDQLGALKARMELAKARVQAADYAAVDGPGLGGDLLVAQIWSYLASVQNHGAMSQRQSGMVERPGLSYGLFHAAVSPNKLYGIVTTSIRFTGAMLDVGHLRAVVWSKDHDRAKWISYNRMRGAYASGMEHRVPEIFLNDKARCNTLDGTPPNPALPPCPLGTSAVRAIAAASAQGQKIYTITTANAHAIDQLRVSPETVAEIRNAVGAGKEVRVHEAPVTIDRWTGAGYIVLDPATGAGGYLIEGKANGGQLFDAIFGTLAVTISLVPFVLIAAVMGPIVLFVLTMAILALVLYEAITMLPEGSMARAFFANLAWTLAFLVIGVALGWTGLGGLLLLAFLEIILNTVLSRSNHVPWRWYAGLKERGGGYATA